MVRWGALAAGAAVVAGAAFVTGASIPPKPVVGPPRPGDVKTVAVGQKIGFFNMARVMRDSKRAKARVEGLNAQRDRLNVNLVGLRAMYVEHQARIAAAKPEAKEAMARETVTLTRMIEDTERAVSKVLNHRATEIIVELYDEMRAEVAEIAREHGLSAVLAYPDAATPEEMENSAVKELKLKPPAAQPFHLDPSADYTDELVRRLNAGFAAVPAGD